MKKREDTLWWLFILRITRSSTLGIHEVTNMYHTQWKCKVWILGRVPINAIEYLRFKTLQCIGLLYFKWKKKVRKLTYARSPKTWKCYTRAKIPMWNQNFMVIYSFAQCVLNTCKVLWNFVQRFKRSCSYKLFISIFKSGPKGPKFPEK